MNTILAGGMSPLARYRHGRARTADGGPGPVETGRSCGTYRPGVRSCSEKSCRLLSVSVLRMLRVFAALS